MKPFQVMDYVSVEDRGNDELWYRIDPNEVYPAMVAHIRDVLASGMAPPQFLQRHHANAKALDGSAWDFALLPKSEVDSADWAIRAEALEIARLWFTALLHVSVGGVPFGLRIIKDDRWRI